MCAYINRCVNSSYIQHGVGASSVRHLRRHAVGHAANITLQERSQDGEGQYQVGLGLL